MTPNTNNRCCEEIHVFAAQQNKEIICTCKCHQTTPTRNNWEVTVRELAAEAGREDDLIDFIKQLVAREKFAHTKSIEERLLAYIPDQDARMDCKKLRQIISSTLQS